MFLDIFNKLDYKQISDYIANIPVSKEDIDVIVNKALSQDRISNDDFIKLLSPKTRPYVDYIKQASFKITQQRHGKVVKLYAPLYVSNECCNSCIYCGFNHKNKITRITLSKEEVLQEAKEIQKMGMQNLLLVAGEFKKNVTVEYLKDLVSELKNLDYIL